MNNFKIYLVTNRVNGKQYIGQTVRSIKDRWRVHCQSHSKVPLLRKAIEKYGKKAFNVEVVVDSLSVEQANNLEVLFIQLNNTLSPNGYNLMTGGKNGLHSEVTCEKIRQANLGREFTDEHRKNLSKPKLMSAAGAKNMGRKGRINGSYRADLQNACLEICFRYQTGESCAELGRVFNVHETTISRMLKDIGIPTRSSGESQRMQNERRRCTQCEN